MVLLCQALTDLACYLSSPHPVPAWPCQWRARPRALQKACSLGGTSWTFDTVCPLQSHVLLNGRVTEDRLLDILHSMAQQAGGAEQTPAAGLTPAGGGPTPAGGDGSHPAQRALLETWMLREYCDMGSLQVRLCLVCALATCSTATST